MMTRQSDDVSRMSKKQLEREVRKLRAEREVLEVGFAAVVASPANNAALKAALDEANSAGWNRAVDLFSQYYEPLMELAWEIESQLGSLKAYVISASRVNKLADIKTVIEEYAKSVGVLLANADPFNRAMAAPFDDVELWVDFSNAWTLYNAALEYVNKSEQSPEYAARLLELSYRKDASSQFVYDLTKAFKPTRQRDKTELTRERAALVKSFVDAGHKVLDAAGRAKEQWDSEHPLDDYSDATFYSDYYKVYGSKKQKIALS